MDTADHPWTLDNPAYGWFGLSSAARVRVGDGVRAVSVAEVVAPTEPMGGLLARDLVVALVRAGVTATCSSADKPRYGHLGVDSNLPDARIALGGPGQNAFTKAVLAAADPAYTVEVERQLADTGRARVWVPAAAPLAAGWVPGADLRDSRALPVLVIASRDDADLGPAIASVADDLVDAEIVVAQQAPSGLQRFESRTVALCNRGVPSFAVETDGTLHTALMRSCTGWPSGVWIDEPRRTAPDGSNFQLQHWTHVFDYALVCGAGDWRARRDPGPQRRVLPPAAGRDGARAGWRAARRPVRCCRSTRPARCTWVRSRRPATRWHTAAPNPSTPAEWPSGWSKPAAATPMSSCARRWARCPSCIRPTCWSSRGSVRSHAHRAARLPDRHRAGATRPAPAAGRRGCRVGPAGRELPAAVRAVLAAQPRAGPAGRATRGGPPASAPAHRRGGRRRGAALDRGQRQQRRAAGRRPSRWCVRPAGRPARPRCPSRCRPANTWRPTCR